MPGLYEVMYEGGGQLPEALSGAYTNVREAHKAIERYKTSKKGN